MTAKYISSASNLSPNDVWDKMTIGAWSFDDCPWVILRNVYASVTFTGNKSWQDIVKDLFKKGQKTFAVLTGRHGDQLGQQVDATGNFLNRNSTKEGDQAIDPNGDDNTANSLRRNQNGLDIIVVDVGNGNHNTAELLKDEIKAQLSGHRIVIIAWCYSLYAMKPGWVVPDVNGSTTANGTPISTISSDWNWLPGLPCAASIEAEKVAVRFN